MKVAEYVANFLADHNIRKIFGYVGGFNADIVDAIGKNGKTSFFLNYHEQAAAFGINAYAMVSDSIAVATASGAPSICNLMGGIVNGYYDSLPCVFIVGTSHSMGEKEHEHIRQNAFEEIDIVSMVKHVTKYAVKITDPNAVQYELEKAFYLAQEGRKGSVLVDIPYDIARQDIDISKLTKFIPEETIYNDFDLDAIQAILTSAKKPIILLGGGARSAHSRAKIKQFLQKMPIPVVTSLLGLDVLPHDHPCFCGFIGHYGHRYANLALAYCDAVIILGSRLDERQLGGYLSKLQDNAKVIRVDIDKYELGRKLPETLSYNNSVENFLEACLDYDWKPCSYSKWHEVLQKWKDRFPTFNISTQKVETGDFLYRLSTMLAHDAVITADVGQNQMSVAQCLELRGNKKLLNCGGYGSMGFSLPAAVGAACVAKDMPIISVSGDGGIQMNIQELHTIIRENLPVKVVVINNNCLGMIRRLHEIMYGNRTYVSVEGYSAPHFEGVAKGYGLTYVRIDAIDQYASLKELLNNDKPCFIEVLVDQEEHHSVEPGATLDKQTPLLSKEEIEQVIKDCFFE